MDLSKNSSVVYNPSYGIGPTGVCLICTHRDMRKRPNGGVCRTTISSNSVRSAPRNSRHTHPSSHWSGWVGHTIKPSMEVKSSSSPPPCPDRARQPQCTSPGRPPSLPLLLQQPRSHRHQVQYPSPHRASSPVQWASPSSWGWGVFTWVCCSSAFDTAALSLFFSVLELCSIPSRGCDFTLFFTWVRCRLLYPIHSRFSVP